MTLKTAKSGLAGKINKDKILPLDAQKVGEMGEMGEMYTREELGPKHFGPYPVQIADYNLSLKDGTLIAIRFWFPGSKLPFEANWDVYCPANNANKSLEVIATKSISLYSPDRQPFRKRFPR